MPLAPGTRLGPYEILAPLGAGGMGEVYRARDGKLARDVAIKILPPDLAGDPEGRQRFEQEARAASALNHPSIVHVYDVDTSGSVHYIAMELVEGRSLREVMLSGPLAVRRLLDLAIEMADGLAKAHAAGIVHRDLKPENVVITHEGHVKILDFGLAKLAEPSTGDLGERSTAKIHTRSGQIMGTVGYMSPEQASGQPVDFRSDQFSLGVILYEMASGRRAFHGKSAAETLAGLLRDQPQALGELSPGVPIVLRWTIEERCLAKDPEERYASTKDLLKELRSVREHLSEASGGPAVVPSARGGRRRWVLAGLGFAAAAALGGPWLFVAGRRSVRIPEPLEFRQITFGRGTIRSARFGPDGETIVYGAAWDGRAFEPFLTHLGSPESRPLGLPATDILAISSSGEMAVSLEPHWIGGWQFAGTLARVALAGGSPRPVHEDVQWADWSPDGKSLAVIRQSGGKNRLEYPIGTVLYKTAGWISHLRVSPAGDLVAFLDHPTQGDDRGSVAVAERSGRKRNLGAEWASAQGLAWSAHGDEIWFTATRTGSARALRALTLAGDERTLAAVTGQLTLHDVSRQARVLLVREGRRTAIRGVPPGSQTERDLSALDWSLPTDLSADGKTLLISEQGEGAPPDYSVYLRRTETDSPPVLLGEGDGLALSPDGRWALAFLPSQRRQLMLLPTGAGEVRRLVETGLEYQSWASFLPDGKRIVCLANEPGRGRACTFKTSRAGGRGPSRPKA